MPKPLEPERGMGQGGGVGYLGVVIDLPAVLIHKAARPVAVSPVSAGKCRQNAGSLGWVGAHQALHHQQQHRLM